LHYPKTLTTLAVLHSFDFPYCYFVDSLSRHSRDQFIFPPLKVYGIHAVCPKPYCQQNAFNLEKMTVNQLILAAFISAAIPASANTTENFNSRKGTALQDIRSNLQNSCWTFHHFNVNLDGWNPKIEGDGAMVSGPQAIEYSNTGIYTPLLNVSSTITVSFNYAFNENFSSSTKRWMKICLGNARNEPVQELEVIHFNGSHASLTKNYSTKFKNIIPGEYRLMILYGGSGGKSKIALDNINTSAPYRYNGGCSIPPLAVKENITGMSDRTAKGSLLKNDSSSNKEKVSAFLIKGSPDGNVQLNTDGSFEFTPNKGFRGNSTSFIYRVCEESGAALCSPNTTVHINFPGSQLTEFKGSYKHDGNVELAWNTSYGNSLDKFELERSVDGRTWQKSGIIPASEKLSNANDYTFIDKVGKNTAHKKDLYYRLKQVESDGTVTTSRLLVIRVYNTKTLSMISVTPNPVKSDIAVNVQLNESSYVSMRIFDNEGKTVIHKIADAEKGITNLLLAGSSKLHPGNYLLEVIVNSKERMLVSLLKE
jgi:hypothetical protein